MPILSGNKLLRDTSDSQYEVCSTMDIISIIQKKTLTNYRVNWEKIYELPANERYPIIYKGDGKFFILVDKDLNINVYETNKGQLITTIKNNKDLEMISWSECYNGEIIDNESTFEYIERSLPLIASVSVSILEDKEKFDFILYGGESQLNLSIFGIFNIENLIKLEGTLLAHVNNEKNIIENYILSQDDNDLVIYKLEIGFLKSYPNLNKLSLICSKISKYFSALQDAIKAINTESKAYIEHSKKIKNLLKDETESYVDELYDVLLTGMMSKGVHIWLTDYLASTGLTRWKTLAMKCFHAVRDLIFTKVIPLIERLILNYTNFTLLIANKSQDQIITKLQSLLKYFYKFINDLNTEFKNFNKFMDWLDLILKSLNEDLSDEKQQEILRLLSNVNIDVISEYLTHEAATSCITEYTTASSPISTLTRDLQVFINAKFSILKMEIKKNLQLANQIKFPNTNIEYYEHAFVKYQEKIYVLTAENLTLNVLVTDMQNYEKKSLQFDQPICKIKTQKDGSVLLLFAQKLARVDVSTFHVTEEIPIEHQNFNAYNMASNDSIMILVDRNQHLIEHLR